MPVTGHAPAYRNSDTALALVQQRRANPTDPDAPKDLLDRMLTVVDAKTGEKMTDESIVDNLITFLIAGHETTAAMLTFLTYELLKRPDVLLKLRAEIDEVLGDQPIVLTDISKMPYTVAVLREILRFHPPAAARFVHCLEPTTIGGGKYALSSDDHILLNSISTNRDPAVWGDDAHEFRPERMLDGGFEKMPPNAWQPFGFGLRACIGRAFAIQEAHMAVATIFQRFDLVMVDPSYQLRVKQTVTLKPDGFYIRAYPRNRKARLYTTPSSAKQLHGTVRQKTTFAASIDVASSQPLYVLYGSNSGTSEGFAQRVASDAPAHGFRPSIGTLDSAAEKIPSDGPVVIITASFEGEPADNAAYFVEWLSNMQGEPLSGLRYAVFGCGNRDWVQTYQRIPRLVDELLGKRGGRALLPRGEGDAGGSEMFNHFDDWEDSLFKTLTGEHHTKSSKSVSSIEIQETAPVTERAATLRQADAALGEVIANNILTAPGKPVKRHLEFELPSNQMYSAGDYLAILPINPDRDVKRVLSRFKLLGEQEITVSSKIPTSLPIGKSITISGLLSGYVELSQPATPRHLRDLVASSKSEAAIQALHNLSETYAEEVLAKRVSILDILEVNPDIQPTFAQYIEMLPPIRVRQYSISSSPLWNPQRVTLTISVVKAPALSGRDEDFMGVATTFLDGLRPGDKVQMAIRPSGAFHLPPDPSVPVVMIAAGSGVAPMRGFIQERALQKEAGRDVGKMTLFFGCRSPEDDFLYSKSDFDKWSKLGILEVRPAFSRDSEKSEGCKHVQDRIWKDRAVISKWFDQGASYYFCGAGKVALEVKSKLKDMIMEGKGCTEEEADRGLERLSKASRFATDIFD